MELSFLKLKRTTLMANFMDLLNGQMTNQVIDLLSDQVGIGNSQQTSNASSAVFSFLTNALANNAASPQGASLLASALDRDHDGSILDDLGGLLLNTSMRSDRTNNGVGILGHLLGGSQNVAIETIARATGLNRGMIASLMVKLAPMVLGALGKQKIQKGYDEVQLGDYLSKSTAREQENQTSVVSALLKKVLDSNGNGSMYDEVAGIGMNVLGGLFK